MTRETPSPGRGRADRDAAVRKALATAIDLHGAGRYEEALRAIEADGGGALKTAIGQNIAGDILLRQGKHREAIKAFDSAARLEPSAPEAYANRGAALEQMGRLEEALAALDRALRLRPDYALAHFNRAKVLKGLGRLQDAVAAYDRAIAANPRLVEAVLNRGLALTRLNRPMDALADFGRVLTQRPKLVAAHLGRAAAYRDIGKYAEAHAALDAALAIEPNNADAAHLRGSVFVAAERYPDALAAADAAIANNPRDEFAHTGRAAALTKLRRLDEALAAVDIALAIAPRFDEAHTTRGIVLSELGRLRESLEALEEARKYGAAGKEYYHARAVALTALGDPKEALANFERALTIDPDNAQAHYNRAFLQLAIGDWQAGWQEHEWRLKIRGYGEGAAPATPRWRGEALAGKRVFVYAEQGYGDTIQFVRYLRLLQGSGAEVTLSVPEPVRRLLAANFPEVTVIDTSRPRIGFDYQISLMSMPAAFATTLESMPGTVPYLFADEERKAKWRARLGEEGFRVGIVWQGNPAYGHDRERSIRLAEYAPLAAVPGVRLISLQSAGGADQLRALPLGMKVEELGEEIIANPDGFREVAAVMANLDLLIMSDTGPTHLAGALGRPVWVALGRYPDWRWMRDRDDSPWYPTMRLFRQTTAGDWGGVFRRLADELRDEVARRK